MSKLEQMIQQLCPDGVEYKKLSEVIRVSRGVRVVKNPLSLDGLKVFFERFFGIGGFAFIETPTSNKIIKYADLASEQPILMIAEEVAQYGKKEEEEK